MNRIRLAHRKSGAWMDLKVIFSTPRFYRTAAGRFALLAFFLFLTGDWALLTARGSDHPFDRASPVKEKDKPPHIVLINLDDADRDMFTNTILRERFPAIHSVASRGVRFDNFHVTSPLCGPSRACLLRGQYAHAIGHRTNDETDSGARGFTGDMSSFVQRGYIDNEMGCWMKHAGYQTIFVGKFINQGKTAKQIPRGWDEYYQSLGSRYFGTLRFTNRSNAVGSVEKLPDNVYRTNAEADDIVRLIDQHVAGEKPLFVYFAPFGPHSEGRAFGGMIDEQDKMEWSDIRQPKQIDFDEVDFTDKPEVYQHLKPLSDEANHFLHDIYRKRMLSTRSIDRAIARILGALEEQGILENTIVFITSDNGFCLGEHRITGKGNSFSRSSHVPLFVAGPGVAVGKSADHLLAHIDLVPTFLAIAGAEPKPFFDGKSFSSLLALPDSIPPSSWRDSVLIENWTARKKKEGTIYSTFCQIRLFDSIYTEWADGSREFYDLKNDPFELENKYHRLSPQVQADLARKIKACRREQQLPIITVEKRYSKTAPSAQTTISGLAEDSSGIHQVQLVIRRTDTNEYWSGSRWQLIACKVSANLKNPLGIQTEWNYVIPAARHHLPQLSITIMATACNGKSLTCAVLPGPEFDASPPITTLNDIRLTTRGKAKITGKAHDNNQVSEVRLHLKNLDNGEYFDGHQWVDTCRCIHCKPGKDSRWELSVPALKQGKYLIQAQAFDVNGNPEPREKERRFSVNR